MVLRSVKGSRWPFYVTVREKVEFFPAAVVMLMRARHRLYRFRTFYRIRVFSTSVDVVDTVDERSMTGQYYCTVTDE